MAFIPPPEQVALVRRQYAEGVPIKRIAAEIGVTNLDIVYRCVDGRCPDGSGIRPAPLPRRRTGVRTYGRNGSRTALIKRIWRTAERHVEEIEARLEAAGLEPAEREGNARALAILVKTLRELAAFDEATAAKRGKAADDSNDDSVPTDLDELRRELARRIDSIVAARGDRGGAGGP
jgi:hypothetical protein